MRTNKRANNLLHTYRFCIDPRPSTCDQMCVFRDEKEEEEEEKKGEKKRKEEKLVRISSLCVDA